MVKVRRPGVVEQIEEDLEILQNLAGVAARRWELADRYDVVGLAVEPALTQIGGNETSALIQVLLRDVTEEQQRQAGMRAYAAHIVRGQEEEPKRIAQELHDDMVQKVVLLCRELDAVETAGAPLPPQTLTWLHAARRSGEEVVARLRDFARALRPPTLDDLGMVSSIRRLVADLRDRKAIDGVVQVAGEERRLGAEVELGIFRIVQEAMRNVERHARATHVTVNITFSEDGVQVEVIDDGLGFTLPTGRDFAAGGQLGLLGMRERTESLGGTLEIVSRPAAGTRVLLSLPGTRLPLDGS